MRSSAYATGLLCARRALPKLGLADKYAGVTEPDGTLQHTEALNEGDAPRLFEFQVLPRRRSIPHVHGRPCFRRDEGCIGRRCRHRLLRHRGPREIHLRWTCLGRSRRKTRNVSVSNSPPTSPMPLTRRTLRRSTPTPAIREDPTCKPTDKEKDRKQTKKYKVARLTVVEHKEKIQKKIDVFHASQDAEAMQEDEDEE